MTQSPNIENSIARHSFYGVKYRPVTQHDIATSALKLNIPVFPINSYSKMPFQGRKWSQYHNWIHSLMELREFYIQTEKLWTPDECNVDINRWAISLNSLICVDVDFSKDKNKSPVGYPQLGPIKQIWLDQASHKQKTQSTYQGKHTFHYFFGKQKRSIQLPNGRVPGTTVDVLRGNRLIILYDELPSIEVWNHLSVMPDELFQCLLSLDRGKNMYLKKEKEHVSEIVHIEEWYWPIGIRNKEFSKEVYYALKNGDAYALFKAVIKAKYSHYPLRDILSVIKSIQINHFNYRNINLNTIRGVYYEY